LNDRTAERELRNGKEQDQTAEKNKKLGRKTAFNFF
jgi:hypothetical protein